MKRLLISVFVMFAGSYVFTPSVNAVAADYTIDCSADSDNSRDNTDREKIYYSGTTLTVYTVNCIYSCASGSADQVTSCGSAFFDNGSPRTFSVTGSAMVHAYAPGSYGVEVSIEMHPSLIGLTATPGKGTVTFNWNDVAHADTYFIEGPRANGGGSREVCEVVVTTCTIEVSDSATHTYVMTILYDWYMWQEGATTVDVAALPVDTTVADTGGDGELANTGSTPMWPAAAMLVGMGAALLVMSRRRLA